MDELQVDNSELEVAPRKRLDPEGVKVYGLEFNGFQSAVDYNDLLPTFKDWYYSKKLKNRDESLRSILQSFNAEVCNPMERKFFPQLYTARKWRDKWDADMRQQIDDGAIVVPEKNTRQVVKTRDEHGRITLGSADDNQLEAGVRSLGGELLNDAFQTLKDTQELEDTFSSAEIHQRKNYVLNVLGYATRMAHGKAALMLKASQEKRDTTGFLMGLLAKASSGNMTDEELALLKTAYAPKIQPDVQQP